LSDFHGFFYLNFRNGTKFNDVRWEGDNSDNHLSQGKGLDMHNPKNRTR